MNAIVLAGSKNDGKLKKTSSATNEALISIGDKPMVQYVVEAISNSKFIKNIVVVGPKQLLQPVFAHVDNITFVPAGDSVIQGVLNGLKKTGHQEQVLIASSDIPLITPEAIDDFVTQCLPLKNVDVFYSIVPKEANDRKFPGVQRTYVSLRGGTYTGGNIFLVKPAIVEKCAAKAEEIFALRKSPIALARLVGLGCIVKFALRILTIREIEKRAGELLGITGKAIISQYPEVGVDVDKPSDLELAHKNIKQSKLDVGRRELDDGKIKKG